MLIRFPERTKGKRSSFGSRSQGDRTVRVLRFATFTGCLTKNADTLKRNKQDGLDRNIDPSRQEIRYQLRSAEELTRIDVFG